MKLARKIREKFKGKLTQQVSSEKRCYICNSTKDVELHHLYPIASVINNWLALKEEELSDEEAITLAEKELPELLDINNMIMLCRVHHKTLHDIFGRTYDLTKVPKVKQWIEKRRSNLKKKEVMGDI